jgi:hypothetical protein
MYSTAPQAANAGVQTIRKIWYNTNTTGGATILSGKTQPTQHSFPPIHQLLLVHWKYLAKLQAQIEE